eukprot:PLAT11849.1.p1 GENE.PLAT11849.1~~PLAT11849.1.p1  ORF type:complete len:1311 (-),score=449.39 PLAT11849.1:73-3516(-)
MDGLIEEDAVSTGAPGSATSSWAKLQADMMLPLAPRVGTARRKFLRKMEEQFMAPFPLLIGRKDRSIIDASLYSVGDELALALSEALPHMPYIRSLLLKGNRFTPRGAAALAEALRESPSVTAVDMADNPLLLRAGGLAIADAVHSCPMMLELSLAGNKIGNHVVTCLAKQPLEHLRKLNLSRNEIGFAAAAGLRTLLTDCEALTEVDLSWNAIRLQAAEAVVTAMTSNATVEVLDLSYNGIGDGGGLLLGTMLRRNATLRELDLTYNRIDEASSIVLGKGLRHNHTLKVLQLSRNPIGARGGKQLIRAHMHGRKVFMKDCNFDTKASSVSTLGFDPDNPSGHVSFSLAAPMQHAMASDLYAMHRDPEVEAYIRNEVYNGAAVSFKNKEELPTEGHLEFDFELIRKRPKLRDCASSSSMRYIHDVMSDFERQDMRTKVDALLMASRDHYFTAGQVMEMLPLLGRSRPQFLVKVVSELYGQVIDPHLLHSHLPEVLKEGDMISLRAALGGYFHFMPGNPSGRYRLFLENTFDRMIAVRLQQIGGEERSARRKVRVDTSQNGNYENWRNVTLDGEPLRYTSSYTLPAHGCLELDYVCTTRPPPGAEPATEAELGVLLENCRTAGSNATRVLRVQTMTHYLLVSQACRLWELFEGETRVDAFVILYARLLDLPNLMDAAIVLLTEEERMQLVHRLGWLNVWNPMHSDGYYELDLAMRDDWRLASLLVKLAVKEPGENWLDETYKGMPFELPLTWVTEVPRKGIVTLTYTTRVGGAALELREKMLQAYLMNPALSMRPDLHAEKEAEEEMHLMQELIELREAAGKRFVKHTNVAEFDKCWDDVRVEFYTGDPGKTWRIMSVFQRHYSALRDGFLFFCSGLPFMDEMTMAHFWTSMKLPAEHKDASACLPSHLISMSGFIELLLQYGVRLAAIKESRGVLSSIDVELENFISEMLLPRIDRICRPGALKQLAKKEIKGELMSSVEPLLLLYRQLTMGQPMSMDTLQEQLLNARIVVDHKILRVAYLMSQAHGSPLRSLEELRTSMGDEAVIADGLPEGGIAGRGLLFLDYLECIGRLSLLLVSEQAPPLRLRSLVAALDRTAPRPRSTVEIVEAEAAAASDAALHDLDILFAAAGDAEDGVDAYMSDEEVDD